MAQLLEPLSDTNLYALSQVQPRTKPDLPEHVLGQIKWLKFSEHPGYYLWDKKLNTNRLVEFVDNNWFYLTTYNDDTNIYIYSEDHIEPYSNNTGYWRITDPEHPDYVPEELPPVASPSAEAGPSSLQVPRQCAETLESEDHSPLHFTPNPYWDQESDHQQEEDNYYNVPQSSVTEATTEVLAAQFQHILDLEDREPENPLTPQVPAYLHLIEEAVEAGLNIPPPPPLAEPEDILEPEPVQLVPFLIQQVIAQPVVQPIMAQPGQAQPVQQVQPALVAPATPPAQQVATDKLCGITPNNFNGDRRKSQQFLHKFNLLWGLNENHEIMTVPYYCAIYALSLMRGPNVDDWVNDQVLKLKEQNTRQQNPIDRTDVCHWDDFNNMFTMAFTDIALEQTAQQKLLAIKMHKHDLDTYIATFNHLCREAQYNHTAKGTIHLLAQGLNPAILKSILFGAGAIPVTMEEWENAARDELKKIAYRDTIFPSNKTQFQWQFKNDNNG